MLLYLVFDWPDSVCYCECEKKLGQPLDGDLQLLLYSSSSQLIHLVIGHLRVLSLVDLMKSQFQLEFESINPQLLNQNILVTFILFQF